ncbi:hypothetical protein SAMN05444506_11123 [Pseudomonas syringae]|nr:hypothetical protein SAMN05444506_11123 [Pseudomonas syringae]
MQRIETGGMQRESERLSQYYLLTRSMDVSGPLPENSSRIATYGMFSERLAILGDRPAPAISRAVPYAAFESADTSCLRLAISMTKRYFTSPLSIRS